jgi:hypothetical protein
MSNINIADFKRPGIYIRETDASPRQIPAQSDLINLVAGFSRKGPVNKPVLITTPQQLFEVFGEIDRLLEKKGCFFHRTILNILKNSPVWAVNLLKTDDNLDLLDWQSISLASDVSNGGVETTPYSSLFNKSEFWYKDSDAFLAVAGESEFNSNQILHITNLGEKKVSVFMFKSSSKGYDVTLESWYGGKTEVPAYLNSYDLASDYMVSVVVVAGDWSDYKALSVDSRWSKYFNAQGLRKEQISNFINDRTVNVLKGYSDLSIIPYFKDLSGRDLFIETVINRDTDVTGIFVAYDIDKIESSEFSTGLLDLVGSNLVGTKQESINYMSYKEIITESVSFNSTKLDREGNAFGDGSLMIETRLVNEPIFEVNGADVILKSGFQYVLNGQVVTVKSDTKVAVIPTGGLKRKDTLYVDSNGVLGAMKGLEVSLETTDENTPLRALPSGLLPVAIVSVGAAPVVLGNIEILPELTWGDANTNDVIVTYNSHNEVTFTFKETKGLSKDIKYKKSKALAVFNQVQSKLKVGSIILDNADKKHVITVFNFVTSGDADKSLHIKLAPSVMISERPIAEIYYTDDELVFGETGAKTSDVVDGVVAVESTLYKAFRDGIINTGDYFFPSVYTNKFTHVDFVSAFNGGGQDHFILYYNGIIDVAKITNQRIRIIGSQVNDMTMNVLGTPVPETGFFNGYTTKLVVNVNESLKDENVLNGDVTVGNVNEVRYLGMFFTNEDLTLKFTDVHNIPTSISTTDYDLSKIIVFSKKSNYKQTLEIEAILATNKVLVKASRYSEIKIGDYLKAFVNTEELEVGEVPKKVTRIISKKLYAADPSLVEVTTDAQIDVQYFGADAQTERYTTMEDYVNTYKAFVLSGFKMRADSMPNGTEERQNAILDMLAKGTPLFKGLTNRNKISWRYLVDCFGLGLTANSKQQLVDLCAERLTCLGFINMPSAKEFKNCSATNFLDNKTKTLRTDFIAKGGDPESNPAFLYSFATGAGQSNVGYFFPHATIQDNGRPLLMPPASFVCNTYMNKHTSRLASVKPWTIAAGITNGMITGIGNVEIDLTNEDIENLNGMNANPVVYKMNRGFVIETNNTAQLSPRSALSYINVREVLINLEEELYQMLLGYQWRTNTKDVRDEIKTKADTICERYVREQGLYDFMNVIDESNNTAEYIDAQIGILDTFVEPVKAMGYIVNNITILKTGDIKLGGFRNI